MPTTFTSNSLADTDRFGAALASCVPEGTTVALCGTLGAGKTRLVQALASACGIDAGEVVSPTFVLCQEYHGQRTLVHIDAYRIADDDEFLDLGVDEHFEGDAIVLIEWAERVAGCLPPQHLEISIEVTGPTQRKFQVRARGSSLDSVIAQLSKTV